MPIVHVQYAIQPDEAAEHRLIEALTATVVEHLDVPPEVVSVILQPIPSSRWGVAGRPLSDHGV